MPPVAYRRWIVAADEASTASRRPLRDVVQRLGGEALRALEDRRLRVDGRPAAPDDDVVEGTWIECWEARDPPPESPRVLDRRGGLVAVYKPAGVATTPDRRGGTSLVDWLADEAPLSEGLKTSGHGSRRATPLPHRARRNLPLGAMAHPVSRLDAGVSGVVLMAVGREATAHAAKTVAGGQHERVYVAIAGGHAGSSAGTWTTEVDGKPARTRFEAIAAPSGAYTLLRLCPETGRMHQLRIHAASAGIPLLGDSKYGGATRVTLGDGAVIAVKRPMLHAMSVAIPDADGRRWQVVAPIAEDLRALWRCLGGSEGDWPEG